MIHIFNFLDTSNLKNDEIYLKLYKTSEAFPEMNYVPAYYFKICRVKGDIEVGNCALRIGFNDNIYYGGHISYEVEEKFRGNHYAGKSCFLMFKLAEKHGMDFVYLTCDTDNFASRKTCEYIGSSFIKIEDLPEDNEMYIAGDRQKCIYKYSFA